MMRVVSRTALIALYLKLITSKLSQAISYVYIFSVNLRCTSKSYSAVVISLFRHASLEQVRVFFV